MDDEEGSKSFTVIQNQIEALQNVISTDSDLFFHNFSFYVSKEKLRKHIEKFSISSDANAEKNAQTTTENLLDQYKSILLLFHLSVCESNDSMSLDENFELVKTSQTASSTSFNRKSLEPGSIVIKENEQQENRAINHTEMSDEENNTGISSLEVVITHPEKESQHDPYNIIHSRKYSDDVHAMIYQPTKLTDAQRKQQQKLHQKSHQILLGILLHTGPSFPKIRACCIAILNQFYCTILKNEEVRWSLQILLFQSTCYKTKLIQLFEEKDWSSHLQFLQTIQISLFPPIWNHFDHQNTSLLLRFFHGMTLRLNENLLSTPEQPSSQSLLVDAFSPKKSPLPSPIKLRENHSTQNLDLIMPNLRMNKHEVGDYTYQTFNLHCDSFFVPHGRVWKTLKTTLFKMLKYASRYTNNLSLSKNTLRCMVLVVLHEQIGHHGERLSLIQYLKVIWKMMKSFHEDQEILYCGLFVSNFILESIGEGKRLQKETAQKHLKFIVETILHQVNFEPETSFLFYELFKYLIQIIDKDNLLWMFKTEKEGGEEDPLQLFEFETVISRIQAIVSRNRQQRYRDRNPLLEHYGSLLWELMTEHQYLFIPERKLNKVPSKSTCAPCCSIM